jgi:hypothetical protein
LQTEFEVKTDHKTWDAKADLKLGGYRFGFLVPWTQVSFITKSKYLQIPFL